MDSAGTLIFITHDREFLQALATRIIELDRGRLFDWTCDYQTFLTRKQAALDAEEKQNALFDKKLAEEEVWIRQGIKARRTRNEGASARSNNCAKSAGSDGNNSATCGCRPPKPIAPAGSSSKQRT